MTDQTGHHDQLHSRRPTAASRACAIRPCRCSIVMLASMRPAPLAVVDGSRATDRFFTSALHFLGTIARRACLGVMFFSRLPCDARDWVPPSRCHAFWIKRQQHQSKVDKGVKVTEERFSFLVDTSGYDIWFLWRPAISQFTRMRVRDRTLFFVFRCCFFCTCAFVPPAVW